MSYTRPSANDADASWLGEAAYTRPPASDADGSFFSSYPADPLPEGTFGTPLATTEGPATGEADSLPSSEFGIPVLALTPEPLPEGVLGEPTGQQLWPASSIGEGVLGEPSILFEAASITGELGVPSSPLPTDPLPEGALGEPEGLQLWPADSLPEGEFGTPFAPAEAVPLPTSTIGEPAGWQNYRASSIPVGTFGTPTTPTDRSGTAASLDASSLGQPVATAATPTVGLGRIVRASPITSSPPTDAGALWDVSAGADLLPEGTLGTPRLPGATGVGYICYAGGLPESTWGEPVGGWDIAEGASALPAGTIPGAASALSGDAATLPSQTPSAAVAILLQRATSLTGAMGVPLVGRTQTAAGLGPSTFGTPKSAQSDTYVPFPLPSSWFGQPVGFSRFEYPADALPAGSLGEPAAYETHLATSIYSTTEFGTPLLRRDALC